MRVVLNVCRETNVVTSKMTKIKEDTFAKLRISPILTILRNEKDVREFGIVGNLLNNLVFVMIIYHVG